MEPAFDAPGRVAALGADAGCGSVDELDQLLGGWRAAPPVLGRPAVEAPPVLVGLARTCVLDVALAAVVERIHPLAEAAPDWLDLRGELAVEL